MARHTNVQYTGTGVSLITPFRNNDIDYPSLERIIKFTLQGGIDFIVLFNEIGEADTLSLIEKSDIIKFVKKTIGDTVPLCVRLSVKSFRAAKVIIDELDLNSVNAVFVDCLDTLDNQDDIVSYYESILDLLENHIILVNKPSNENNNISTETVLELVNKKPKQVIGILNFATNIPYFMQLVHQSHKDFLVIEGNDLYTIPMVSAGASAILSETSNVIPEQFTLMTNSTYVSNLKRARKHHKVIWDLMQILHLDNNNPAAIKAALSYFGICRNEVRKPHETVSIELMKDIRAEIVKL